jgi:uncharacterized protein YqiB (DUF1249 family)
MMKNNNLNNESQFLNEWLHLCLAHGQVEVELKTNL